MCNKNTQFSVAVKADKSGEYELNGSNGNQNHVRKIHQQIKWMARGDEMAGVWERKSK